MPIFEYVCKDCSKSFEALVYGTQQAECPACKSQNLEQQMSTFAARAKGSSSAGTAPCGAPMGSCGGGGCGIN